MEKLNIYPDRAKWDKIKKKIKEAQISDKNKKLIIEFLEHGKIYGYNSKGRKVSMHRIEKYGQQMRYITKQINKELQKAKKKDIEKLIIWIDENYPADQTETNADYKITLKVFYKWLESKKLDISLKQLELQRKEPEIITWFATRTGETRNKLPENLLTEKEVLSLIRFADNIRDKAFISTLFESTCRIGEIGNLALKDVIFDEYGSVLMVNGKTGQRRIRLISSTPYLKKWINEHPLNDNSTNPLWTSTQSKNQLTYAALRKILRTTGKKAGIKKPLNPHIFRHSKATQLAKHLTEQQLKAYGGWKQSSKMVQVYVHLSGKDIDDKMLEINGIKQSSKEKKSIMLPKTCSKCKSINEATAIYCKDCSSPLTLEAALQTDFNKELTMKTMEEKMKLLEEKISQLITKK